MGFFVTRGCLPIEFPSLWHVSFQLGGNCLDATDLYLLRAVVGVVVAAKVGGVLSEYWYYCNCPLRCRILNEVSTV
ncbi:hypothetical protein PC119_g20215 [Phytophthora cactorum]|nr:hypothetical protein PC119_g20215 [Phytophthora cactorum]KAG3002604.1 hypothetical protein PC120_g19639 [Phytophthora cactorum]KAG3140529.1 hypothetical protein C6341_g20016 [Phytophthora cactorum]KAG3162504.1 hypothetical protein PC128_g20593 [Phytophthora cactorum]KAG4044453.1 hypothetical protein PC123_g20109 [Phytophthora cactorum]